MKRPFSNITQGSIKPSLSKAVEFYTNSRKQAYKCIQDRDEYINFLENKLDVNNQLQQQSQPVVPECVEKQHPKKIDSVNDEDRLVRSAVAEQGRDKDLDILVHDKDWHVRSAVAKHGRNKDLDILVHDKDWDVRGAVARQGRDKDLDILVHDENNYVRCVVARKGRDKYLDILVHDEAGNLVKVIDVKGMILPEFKIKAKMFAARYGLPITIAKKVARKDEFTEKVI